jgi:D-ribose pyranose/furanose isomerase RbsD
MKESYLQMAPYLADFLGRDDRIWTCDTYVPHPAETRFARLDLYKHQDVSTYEEPGEPA